MVRCSEDARTVMGCPLAPSFTLSPRLNDIRCDSTADDLSGRDQCVRVSGGGPRRTTAQLQDFCRKAVGFVETPRRPDGLPRRMNTGGLGRNRTTDTRI